MNGLIGKALALWRDAERMLDTLPPGSPEHERVSRLLAELREVYARLTASRSASDAQVRDSRQVIERARAELAEVKHRQRPS